MLNGLIENGGTILVVAVLVAVVGSIIAHLRKAKRQGKTVCGCGGSCAHCALGCACHHTEDKNKQ